MILPVMIFSYHCSKITSAGEPMSVSYEYYKYFYYVAKYKSFNKAAAVLSNSQPNLSRTITLLENELGCKLFVRSPKGAELTEAGKALFTHVEAAKNHITIAEDLIHSGLELKSGHLNIGLSIGIAMHILREQILPLIRTFHEKYPDIRLHVTNDSTPDLMAGVSEGIIDMAVITTPYKEKKGFKKTILRSFRDIVIAGPEFSELKDKKISLSKIVEYPLVCLWHGTETFELYNNFFAEHGLEFSPAVETTDTWQTLAFVADNLGIGNIYPSGAEQALKENRIFRINLKEKLPERYVALIYDDSKDKTPAAEAFERILTDSLHSSASR